MKPSFSILLLTCSWLSIPVLAQTTTTCPGVFAVTSGAVSGCCVGAPTPSGNAKVLEARRTTTKVVAAATTVITTKTKTKTSKTSSSTLGPLTCATWIPVTQANYTGLLQEASMSLISTGTNLRTTITPVTTGAAATSKSAAEGPLQSANFNIAALVGAVVAWLL